MIFQSAVVAPSTTPSSAPSSQPRRRAAGSPGTLQRLGQRAAQDFGWLLLSLALIALGLFTLHVLCERFAPEYYHFQQPSSLPFQSNFFSEFLN